MEDLDIRGWDWELGDVLRLNTGNIYSILVIDTLSEFNLVNKVLELYDDTDLGMNMIVRNLRLGYLNG